MSNSTNVKIFSMTQTASCSCGPQASCCGPSAPSEEDIQNLKNDIEKETNYQVTIIDAANLEEMKNYKQFSQIINSFGLQALPIVTLNDEVVLMGSVQSERVISAIKAHSK